jgi:probable F420-dependent oxidoreductase
MTRSLRIGHQLSARLGGDPLVAAVRAEELGFDIVVAADHVGPGWSPMPTLAAIAAVTDRIRLGTLVLNNDMRNPVQLAWEVSTIDRLSHGRFELGLGAGHTPAEYDATGVARSAPADRKRRLAESVEIIRRLLDGELVDHEGEHYRVHGAAIDRAVQQRLPILVGGNGAALLAHAGRHADVVGLQGLGRTREDGHSHEVKWSTRHLDAQIEQVRTGAGVRFDDIEFNALVQVVQITDDRDAALAEVVERVDGLTMDDAASTPYLLIGSVDEIIDHMTTCNERWGIGYFVVRELDDFEPVLRVLRTR